MKVAKMDWDWNGGLINMFIMANLAEIRNRELEL